MSANEFSYDYDGDSNITIPYVGYQFGGFSAVNEGPIAPETIELLDDNPETNGVLSSVSQVFLTAIWPRFDGHRLSRFAMG